MTSLGVRRGAWWVAAALTGCSLHEVPREPAPPLPTPIPERFSEAPQEPAAQQPARVERWWTSFGDPELDRLVELAIADNLDLERAAARVRQAEAAREFAGAGQLPTLQAQAGVSGARTVFNLGPPIGVRSNEAANYTLGVSAAWEVDLWGRLGHAVDAAELDVAAAREDQSAAALSIAGRVTDLYLQVAGEAALLELLDLQAKSNAKLVELVELRFAQGLATALEVYQQRQQLAALEAQRPLADARLTIARHQLALLLGRTPGALALAPGKLPALPPAPAAGVPSEVLLRRPDVRAAMLRVSAADHRVGAAIAAQYPSLNLSASTGFQSPDLADLFERWVWTLAANLVAPLFDGGRRGAEVERTEAVVAELVQVYGQAVLTAVAEVEGALAQEARQRQHLELVLAQVELARAAYTEAELRYANGLASYLEVLTALRSVQQAEQAELQARRQLLAYRVQLHRALGGTWASASPTNPEPTRRGEP